MSRKKLEAEIPVREKGNTVSITLESHNIALFASILTHTLPPIC
ncbi:MAG: hypothetical protein ACFFD1_02640 [Candidatus Thorarchaeota archaeon]